MASTNFKVDVSVDQVLRYQLPNHPGAPSTDPNHLGTMFARASALSPDLPGRANGGGPLIDPVLSVPMPLPLPLA